MLTKEEIKINLEKMTRAELVSFAQGIEVASPKTGKMIQFNSYLLYMLEATFKSVRKSDLIFCLLMVLTSVKHKCFGDSAVTEKVLLNETIVYKKKLNYSLIYLIIYT